jgi:DNA-binding beta-propeller fold protein YncE
LAGNRRRASLTAIAISAACALLAVAPSTALAGNLVFWANDTNPGMVSGANIDNTGGLNIVPGAATSAFLIGVAIDPATNKVYWANFSANRISFANLDGSGGGDLNTVGATVNGPEGVDIDPAANKIYWANTLGNTLSFANLDGTGGGGTVNTAGDILNAPRGVAIDPAANKIYWASTGNSLIQFANLDNSGGAGNLNTGAATANGPDGVAIDRATNKIFWANAIGNKISFANLDNSGGGGDLDTTGAAAVNLPTGVAVDHEANRVYWADGSGDQISFANEDGSAGGGNVNTGTATLRLPDFPALLKVPKAAGAPVVSGGATAPTTLSCTSGSWADNLLGSMLYRAPRSFSFNWTNNGAPVAGATTPSITATTPGSYVCHVTATNFAGSTAQASSAFAVASAPSTPPPPTARLASLSRSGATQLLTVACDGAAGQVCSGSVVGTVREHKRAATILGVTARKRNKNGGRQTTVTVTVATASFTVPAGGAVTTGIALNGTGVRLLGRFQRLQVRLSFTGSVAATRTVVFTLPRLRASTPPDNWFHIDPPCSDCYSSAQNVPIAGLPRGVHVTVSCDGSGCPFSRRSVGPHDGRINVAAVLGSRHLQPGAVVEVAITAPGRIGVVLRYAIRRGAGPVRTILCQAPGASRPGPCS